jgi:hypothetical protein
MSRRCDHAMRAGMDDMLCLTCGLGLDYQLSVYSPYKTKQWRGRIQACRCVAH